MIIDRLNKPVLFYSVAMATKYQTIKKEWLYFYNQRDIVYPWQHKHNIQGGSHMEGENGITIITASNDEPKPAAAKSDEGMEGIPTWAKELQESMKKLLEAKAQPAPEAKPEPVSSKGSQIPEPPPAPKKEPEPAALPKKESIIGKAVKFLF